MSLEYNTQQKRLPLPEYGRSVQNMVDYALTIADRAERQRCANTIVNIMGGMFPHLRDVPDYKHKLWDHLAIMADFKLDIDYPYEVVKEDLLHAKPEPLPYPGNNIRYRHYGKLLEVMVEKALEFPEGSRERTRMVSLIANHMKKCFLAWNKDSVENEKIYADLREYSHGQIDLKEGDVRMVEPRNFPQRKTRQNNKRYK